MAVAEALLLGLSRQNPMYTDCSSYPAACWLGQIQNSSQPKKDKRLNAFEEQFLYLLHFLPEDTCSASVLSAPQLMIYALNIFFLLLAAKVRSSCEEGPGQSALQSAYHNPKLDVNELKQNETS